MVALVTKEELQAAFPPGEYRSLEDVGKQYGFTRQRIHQLVKQWGIVRADPPPGETYGHLMAISPHSPWPREGGITRFKRARGMCLWGKCYAMAAPNRRCCPHHLAENSKRTQARYREEKNR